MPLFVRHHYRAILAGRMQSQLCPVFGVCRIKIVLVAKSRWGNAGPHLKPTAQKRSAQILNPQRSF
jgi:hypothetical protein